MHLSFKKGFNEKNITVTTSGVTIFVFKCHYMWPCNSSFRKSNRFGNLTLPLHFIEVLKIILIIKYFVR